MVPPSHVHPETVAGAGLPATAARLHALHVMGGLQTCVLALHDPVLQSASAVHTVPPPH